jgi:FMN phosphatase YigB (HAD superfamily)
MDAYLRQQGLAELLDAVVYSADVGVRKPDPKPFMTALARLGARPPNAVHVGDSLAVDMAGAAAAGIAGIWFWGNCPKVGKLAAGAPLGPGTWPDLSSLPELAATAARLAGEAYGGGTARQPAALAGAARDYPELKSLLFSKAAST